jgi:hypothetical protein
MILERIFMSAVQEHSQVGLTKVNDLQVSQNNNFSRADGAEFLIIMIIRIVLKVMFILPSSWMELFSLYQLQI